MWEIDFDAKKSEKMCIEALTECIKASSKRAKPWLGVRRRWPRQNMIQICQKYDPNTQKIWSKYAKYDPNMQKYDPIRTKMWSNYAKMKSNMQKMWSKYAKNVAQICKKWDQNMQNWDPIYKKCDPNMQKNMMQICKKNVIQICKNVI